MVSRFILQKRFYSRLALLSALAAAVFGTSVFGQEDPALLNVSTRGQVGTGDNVMIAGFIIAGTAPRRVAIRVTGPSLAKYGLTGLLANPTFELHGSASKLLATNDDWQSDAVSAQTLRDIGLPPERAEEAALVSTLAPGDYTVVITGKGNTSGLALVEVFDLETRDNSGVTSSRTINLSTRGRVGTGGDVMIMGFIISGTASRDILVKGVAGSLSEFGVQGELSDSKIEVHAGDKTIAENDDWINSSDFEAIARTGAAPLNPAEGAVLLHLAPGSYTAIVSGPNGEQGVALPEVDDIRGLRDIAFAPANLVDRTASIVVSTGGPAESHTLSFIGAGSATVDTGTAGTYTFTRTSNFYGNLSITAGGYTFTGTVQFYRENQAVFEGSLTKPGAAKQDAQGFLVLKKP